MIVRCAGPLAWDLRLGTVALDLWARIFRKDISLGILRLPIFVDLSLGIRRL